MELRKRTAKRYTILDTSTDEEQEEETITSVSTNGGSKRESAQWQAVLEKTVSSSTKGISLVNLESDDEQSETDSRRQETSPSTGVNAIEEVEGDVRPPPFLLVKCKPAPVRPASPETILGADPVETEELLRQLKKIVGSEE